MRIHLSQTCLLKNKFAVTWEKPTTQRKILLSFILIHSQRNRHCCYQATNEKRYPVHPEFISIGFSIENALGIDSLGNISIVSTSFFPHITFTFILFCPCFSSFYNGFLTIEFALFIYFIELNLIAYNNVVWFEIVADCYLYRRSKEQKNGWKEREKEEGRMGEVNNFDIWHILCIYDEFGLFFIMHTHSHTRLLYQINV